MVDQSRDFDLAAGFEPATSEAWLALVEKVLKGSDFESRLVSHTLDGIRIAPLYTRADALPGADVAQPGEPPFTRGTAAASTPPGWDIRQFHFLTDAKETNSAILEDIKGGTTSVALLMALAGNSGHAAAFDALRAALDGVDLSSCPVALVAGEQVADAAGLVG